LDKRALAGILLIALAVVLFGCTQRQELVDSKTAIPLKNIEIKDYNGKNLSSVNDFRENSIKGPQHVDINSYKLKITGLVETPKYYSYQEVLDGFQSYKKIITLNCVEGWSATILWEGPLLKNIISQSKPLANADTIIFHAADGYTTSFPIEYVMDNNLILAYKMNEVALPPERGFPFQLVAESKWGYKWIKWITEIELSDDSSYQGYWESRGYSNNGDLNKGFIGN
jgi:DMSO/TMAO reductase YedYZ molybdopterin-dependent catalytic subunit